MFDTTYMMRFERADEGGEVMGKDNDLSEEEKDSKVDVVAISVIISALVAGAVVFISGVSIDL